MAPHLDAEQEGRIREAQEGIDTDGLEAYPGARSLLQSLPPHSWAVVTSGNSRTASEDVQLGKPDPEAFLLAAKRLGVQPEECVMIEDASAGIEAARAAGMRVIAVATTHGPEALTQAGRLG